MNHTLARQLMDEFADDTGLTSSALPRRYLWTDAFAVCNFLALAQDTGSDHYLNLAQQLVNQVHHVLGRHRSDDVREGWISGLPEEFGRLHPTRCGLRIGKKLNERAADEPPDSQLEWDQDGQYFHYLTKWIHALLNMHAVTCDDRYRDWATELGLAANRAFTYRWRPGEPKRMYWKMSIDLTRPLVPSMGHHDPLDALVSYLELQSAADTPNVELLAAIRNMSEICTNVDWATEDALGIGGLLDAATRLAPYATNPEDDYHSLLQGLLADADLSLRHFCRNPLFMVPANHRLAFRELGLAIGLHGLPRLSRLVTDTQLVAACDRLQRYFPLAEEIAAYWSDEHHWSGRTWREHRDINSVMLATSLIPHGYFGTSKDATERCTGLSKESPLH